MAAKLRPSQYADAKGVIAETFTGHAALCEGTTVPTDGTAGYAPGCLWLLRAGAVGGQLYMNEGSVTSCDFNAILSNIAPTESITSSTRTLTAADSGKTFVLNLAAGIAVTLPPPAVGMEFSFIIGTTFTGAATIKSASGSHIMVGHAVLGNDTDNSVVMWQALASSTFDTINMFGTANSTGGFQGQTIEITGISATMWHVKIAGDAAGTEATPFQDTVA